MNHFLIALSVALVASAQVYGYSAGNNYHQGEHAAGDYHAGDANAASAAASANGADTAANAAPSSYGTSQNIPYQPANTRGNSISSSISYPNNKGEILIHRPAAIIVKRPPTKVVVNHPPLVVKPAPVVLHKPPAVVVRKVVVKHHPRPVKVEPVYVNVVKPPAEKYFVNEKQQQYAAPQQYGAININAGGYAAGAPTAGASAASASDASAAANSGYQLLQNNQGLAALANLSGSGQGHYGHHDASPQSYNAPSY